MLSDKVMIILLTAGLMKKMSLYKMILFFKLYSYNKSKTKVELGLSNYATESNFDVVTGIDTSEFAKKVDLASLKLDVDKIIIGKSKTAPTTLRKVSHVVRNDVINRTV